MIKHLNFFVMLKNTKMKIYAVDQLDLRFAFFMFYEIDYTSIFYVHIPLKNGVFGFSFNLWLFTIIYILFND